VEEELLTRLAATLEPFGRPLPLPLVGEMLGFFSPGTNLLGDLEARCLRALAAVGAAATDLRRADFLTLAMARTRTRLCLGLGIDFKGRKLTD
jgi:hypothetical protein